MSKDQSKRKAILITGNDDFAIKKRAEAILKNIAPADPMNLETISGYVNSVDEAVKQIAQAIEALQTLPFFGGRKVVHFKEMNFAGDSVLGRSETVQSALEDFLSVVEKTPVDQVQLLLTAIGIDKRRSFFRSFSKLGEVENFDKVDIAKSRERGEWLDFVERKTREVGLKTGPGVVEMLVELAGNDSRTLDQEIEKLRLYSHPHGEITENDVRLLGSGNREMVVWDLCNAITTGHSTEALRLLKQLLAQGESEVGLLIILGQHVRLAALGMYLHETKRLHLRQKGSFMDVQINEEGENLLPRNKKGEKPNLYRLGNILRQAMKKESRRWFKAIEIVHQTHQQLFSMSGGNERNRLLESAILHLCSI